MDKIESQETLHELKRLVLNGESAERYIEAINNGIDALSQTETVSCHECNRSISFSYDYLYCQKFKRPVNRIDFCSWAEKKEDC